MSLALRVRQIYQLARGRQRVILSAGVRVAGALLTFLGVAFGARCLGLEQFGSSIVALSVGQVLALPFTAQERLIIRLATHGQASAVERVMRRTYGYCTALALTTSAVCLLLQTPEHRMLAAASGITGITASLMMVTQGLNRAMGHLSWGQVPNELARPLFTLAAYPIAAVWSPPSLSGAFATALASCATLALLTAAPRRLTTSSASASATNTSSLRGATASLIFVSLVAVAMERGLPILLKTFGETADVAVFAAVLRVVQMALFLQSFGLFYFAPAIAHAFKEPSTHMDGIRLTRRVRALGLLAAVPTAMLCVLWPNALDMFLGSAVGARTEMVLAAVAVAALALGAGAQNALVLGGQEVTVAASYAVGAVTAAVSCLAFGGATAAGAVAAAAGLYAGCTTYQMVAFRRAYGHWA